MDTDLPTLVSHGALRGIALGSCLGVVWEASSTSRKGKGPFSGAGRFLVLGALSGAALVVSKAFYEKGSSTNFIQDVTDAARSLVESKGACVCV